LVAATAVDTTTASAPSLLRAAWRPTAIVTPSFARRRVAAFSARSEPDTL